MSKEVGEFILFVNQMYKALREEKYYKQWLVQLPWMSKENYVSFEQYRENITGKNIDNRTTEEIEAEIDEIEKKFQRKGGN